MIRTEGIYKSFSDTEVLKGIDFSMKKGEVTAIIGPSGSGKSTFLRCLINLEQIGCGSIFIDGQSLVKDGVYGSERHCQKVCLKMGMVFQHFNLFPHMTVGGNLMVGPITNQKMDKADALIKCKDLLKKVGLEEKLDAYPGSLSGGQKQRVAIARAMMMSPEILLFDEPTSALDPELTGEVLDVISDLAKENMTMMIVTHEIQFAKEVAGRIVFMDSGVISGDGTPAEILENPETPRLKSFLQRVL